MVGLDAAGVVLLCRNLLLCRRLVVLAVLVLGRVDDLGPAVQGQLVAQFHAAVAALDHGFDLCAEVESKWGKRGAQMSRTWMHMN